MTLRTASGSPSSSPTLNLVSFYSHSFFSQVWLRASWCLCLFKSFTRKNGPSLLSCALECSGFGSALHVFLGWLVGFLQVLMPIWLTGGAGPRDLTLAHRAKNTASLCRDDCAVLSHFVSACTLFVWLERFKLKTLKINCCNLWHLPGKIYLRCWFSVCDDVEYSPHFTIKTNILRFFYAEFIW